MAAPPTAPPPAHRAIDPPKARVRLEPLPARALDDYLASLLKEYAEDHVRDGQWSAEEAPEKARAEVAGLLPRGLDTPDHYFRSIVADPEGNPVGRLWYALRRDGGPPHLFIYDLLVFETERGHGYGEAALRALEPVARELGVPRIALHVFGHNTGAIRLYERVGYRATNVLMSKSVVDPSPAP